MTRIEPSKFASEVEREWRRFPEFDVDAEGIAVSRELCRAHFDRLAARPRPPRAGVRAEDTTVPSLTDDHAIPVRVYRPDEVSGRGLLYMHGGGFALGDLDMEDENCWTWAREAQCVVVSVDYRLAPEHRYPVPLEDCHSALRWVAEHAERLAIDPQRLGVGGCSAGGGLAAGLALLARDRGGPSLGFQMLLYPALDPAMSGASLGDAAEDYAVLWERYLGPSAEVPVYASPVSCEDLTGLPPAYVATAEHDALRDEAILYAQRLIAAGVSAELRLWPGTPHAFELFVPDASVARRSVSEQAGAIARTLEESATRAV